MYELKHKSQKKQKELTPDQRIEWLLDFIEIQGQINPTPKKPSEGFELRKRK